MISLGCYNVIPGLDEATWGRPNAQLMVEVLNFQATIACVQPSLIPLQTHVRQQTKQEIAVLMLALSWAHLTRLFLQCCILEILNLISRWQSLADGDGAQNKRADSSYPLYASHAFRVHGAVRQCQGHLCRAVRAADWAVVHPDLADKA